MAGIPSIGDILMLSQLAWKIGRAFTSGRAGAPTEFQEVENELHGLTKSLTLLAEALDQDDSIISRADEKTKEGLDKILECCRQTLENLDSFVSQYQEIKRPDGGINAATQRSWKRLLIRNYKTICWTGEGGTIQALRNMLHMHVNSISLTMQALHSRSLSRLENTIEPMADKVDDMHDKLNGDLNVKINEMHHLMLSMASADSAPRAWSSRSESVASSVGAPLEELQRTQLNSLSAADGKLRDSSSPDIKPRNTDKGAAGLKDNEYLSQPALMKSASTCSAGGSHLNRPESTVIGFGGLMSPFPEAPPQYEKNRHALQFTPRSSSGSSQAFETDAQRRPSNLPSPISPGGPMMLPLPAIGSDTEETAIRANTYDFSKVTATEPAPRHLTKTTTTEVQYSEFQKAITEDAAVLCQVRGRCTEYTQPDEEEPGGFKMVQATSECQIYLITKRHKLSNGLMCFTTSIWVLSDDRSVRLQQELADGQEIIPYTVWGNNVKISIRVPTELRFHDLAYDSKPIAVARTSWVNYWFEDERDSTIFQSALMGKSLLLSVRTTKTMRLHDGFTGNFAYQEQMCALENLRIWQDQDTGGVLAMIHYSAQFRNGYMAFYLNSSRDPVRVRDDGDKFVKLKGLSIPLQRPTMVRQKSMDHTKSPKLKNDKRVTGVRIEFTTDMDKRLFLEKFREVQGTVFAGER